MPLLAALFVVDYRLPFSVNSHGIGVLAADIHIEIANSIGQRVVELCLYQRDTEFSIKAGNYKLMNSRVYGSEDALAKLAVEHHVHSRL